MLVNMPRSLTAPVVLVLAIGAGGLFGAGSAAARLSAQDSFSFSSSSYSLGEADGSAKITINRTGSDVGLASVQFATVNGTATAGSDYTDASQTVNFADGQSTATVTVSITNDSVGEGDETVVHSLANPSGGSVLGNPSAATLTIVDDDTSFAFSGGSFYAVESDGAAYVTVHRVGVQTGVGSVHVATANGTAIAGTDYTAVSQTLTFADGQSSQNVTIPLIDDKRADGAETIMLSLSSPSAGTSLTDPSVVTLTIFDAEKPSPVAQAPAGRIFSARLTKTSLRSYEAGVVKVVYNVYPRSKRFAYVLSLRTGSTWTVVRVFGRTGSFVGKYTITVKKLFGTTPVRSGRYRLKLSADKNSKTLTFKVT